MKGLRGPMTQLAWVVEDLDAAERAQPDVRWTRLPAIRFGPDHRLLRGRPADFVADIALGYAGDLQLELIAPVSGDSIYTEHLAVHGPGLHHGCWETDDLDATIAAVEASGRTCVQRGSMAGGEIEFAYLEPGLPGLPVVEVVRIGPGMRAFYDQLRAD